MSNELSDLLPEVIRIAEQAGEKILEIYASEFAITHKDDNTPLTEADMAAHNCIVKELGALTPDLPILSEESAKISFAERATWQRYWLVDPLDGTREFIKRNGEFTVNIALIDNHSPTMGVIFTPVSGVLYYAAQKTGAFKREPGKEVAPIQTRKKQGDTTLLAGSRSHRGESLDRFIENVGKHDFISMGSSLKSCLVAEGKVDLYPRLGPTSEWDTAAAQCIVEEAGGRLTEMDMQPMRYNTKESLLNPHFFVCGDPEVDWSQYLQ